MPALICANKNLMAVLLCFVFRLMCRWLKRLISFIIRVQKYEFESQRAFPGYLSPGRKGFRAHRLPLRKNLFVAIFYFLLSSPTRTPCDISTQVPGEVCFTYTKSLLFWQPQCICLEGLHHFAKNDMKRPVLKLAMTMFSSRFGWGNNKLGS